MRSSNRLLPLANLAEDLLDAVARWLDEPEAANAEAVREVWPPVLRERAKAAQLAELVGVSWPALWTLRWLGRSASGPADEVSAAVGYVATHAEVALEDRGRVSEAARAALRASLLAA